MEEGRLLIAIGLTVWLGGLVAAVAYTRRRMRFPKSMYARYSWFPSKYRAIAGLLLFAAAAYWEPMVTWVATTFASGLGIYAMGAYVIALTYEGGGRCGASSRAWHGRHHQLRRERRLPVYRSALRHRCSSADSLRNRE